LEGLRKSREDHLEDQRRQNAYRSNKARDSVSYKTITRLERKEAEKAEKEERRMTYLAQLEANERHRMDNLVHRLERKDQVFEGYLDKQFQ